MYIQRNNNFHLQNMYWTPRTRTNNTKTTTNIATLFAEPLPFGWFCVRGSSRVSDPARFRFRAPPVGMPSGGLNKQTNKQTNKHHNKPRHVHYLFLQSIISHCLALEFWFTPWYKLLCKTSTTYFIFFNTEELHKYTTNIKCEYHKDEEISSKHNYSLVLFQRLAGKAYT